MNRLFHLSILSTSFILLMVLLSGNTLLAQSEKSHKIDSILSAYYGPNSPSVGIVLIKGEELKVKETYGYANIEEKKMASITTNYDLATLTEQFTVMSTLILLEQNRIKLEDLLSEIFPGLPAYCSNIQVKHLLNHTSGLPLIQNDHFYNDIKSFNDILTFLSDKKGLKTSPGKQAQQNILNYALLANLVERITNKSYRKFVEENIFQPLAMKKSRVYKKGWFTSVPNKATSYLRRNDTTFEMAGKFPKKYVEGAIGIFSNLEDIQQWFKAWTTDKLVSQDLLKKAKHLNFIPGQKNFPGYGWIKAFNAKQRYLYRAGIGHGNSHILLHIPNEDIFVAILSNQSGLFGLHRRAFELVNLYSERQYSTD